MPDLHILRLLTWWAVKPIILCGWSILCAYGMAWRVAPEWMAYTLGLFCVNTYVKGKLIKQSSKIVGRFIIAPIALVTMCVAWLWPMTGVLLVGCGLVLAALMWVLDWVAVLILAGILTLSGAI